MQPKEQVDSRNQLKTLIRRALQGEITISNLFEEAPQEIDDPLTATILEHLEAGIEHTPGKLFSGQIDYEAWEASPEYRQLFFDLRILESTVTADESLKWIKAVDPGEFEGPEHVEEFVANLAKQSQNE